MVDEYILLVEDDPAVRRDVIRDLQREFREYDVTGVGSYSNAKRLIKSIRRKNGILRLVVVDEALKADGRGSDLLVYLTRYYPGVRKVMLAAEATMSDLAKAINEGKVDRYVLKADYRRDKRVLLLAVRRALEEHGGPIFDALVEMLERAESERGGRELLLVAGRRMMTASELLRHITQGTRIGQQHLRHFALLIQHALQNPRAVLEEMARVEEARKSTKAARGRRTKRRRRTGHR